MGKVAKWGTNGSSLGLRLVLTGSIVSAPLAIPGKMMFIQRKSPQFKSDVKTS